MENKTNKTDFGLSGHNLKRMICGLLISYILVTSYMYSVSAAVPKEDPFFSIGEDFLVIKAQDYHPQLNILFDNTNIYIDTDNDGTWNYHYTRNMV